MIEIKDILAKFSNLLISEELKKEIISGVVFKNTGIKIQKEDIKIKNGTLFLNTKPINKNEILLKKEKIISELEGSLGKKAPKDIR